MTQSSQYGSYSSYSNNSGSSSPHHRHLHPSSPSSRRRNNLCIATSYPAFHRVVSASALINSNNNNTMAVPIIRPSVDSSSQQQQQQHNPQDPEGGGTNNGVLLLDPRKKYYSHSTKTSNSKKKRKPNRTIMYLRHRMRNYCRNASAIIVGALLVSLSVHRCISLIMRNRKWINAPISYLTRTCPAINYEPITSNGGLLLTTDDDIVHNKEINPKICITTLTDQKSQTSTFQRFMRWRNFDGILELTWPNKLSYAKKHGYELYDGSHLLDPSRPPAWTKIKAVQHLMDKNLYECDWIMWTDADTVIMNSDIRITDFLPSESKYDMLVAADKGGGYNSGVFLFRNNAWSTEFLDKWWNMKEFVRPPGLALSGDNAAMKHLLANMDDDEFKQHVLAPPRCTFNSFAKFLTLGQSLRVMDDLENQEWYMDTGHYHKTDFIAHTPGVDNKAECLQLLLREAR